MHTRGKDEMSLARLLKPSEIAERWGCKVQFVHGLIRDGQLRGVRIGGGDRKPRFRVRPEDLDQFERGREVDPSPRRGRRQKHENLTGWAAVLASQ